MANSAMNHATGSKKARAVSKVIAQQPVDALLALDSGCRTFNVNFDRFLQCFDGDPLNLDDAYLQNLDLLQVPALIFLSDREGSQTLG